MTSDLFVAFSRRRAIFEIHALQNGVVAVALLDGKNGLLPPPFALTRLLIGTGRVRLLLRGGKEIQLLTALDRAGDFVLRQNAVCRDRHAAHEKVFVRNAVIERHDRVRDLAR